MVRQCAWCLRQIDDMGERLSVKPLPKNYDASHGMCRECGEQWLEAVLSNPCWLESKESCTVSDEAGDYRAIFERGLIQV